MAIAPAPLLVSVLLCVIVVPRIVMPKLPDELMGELRVVVPLLALCKSEETVVVG